MYNLNQQEELILEFWKKNNIYEKLKKKNRNKKSFYFMDGPPYATGNIHMGTALNKILKDIAMRYKRVSGFDVFDKAGYDTHGLPIENKVEKKLCFTKKEDIEKYGIKKFIKECKKYATQFIDIMNQEFMNLGVWMDFKNCYLTLDKGYIETIWDTFKTADKKNLLYLGKYPIHACTHCETAVAYNEIEYTKQKDLSIYVKFKIKNWKNKFLLIWTTTPWTLPSNTGVMANPNFDYVELEVGNEIWILAKDRVNDLMKKINKNHKVKRVFKGKELNGLEYENPISKYLNLKLEKAYRIILNERYVNLEEGTGLVHTAPGCGKEDFEAGIKAGLPMISIISLNGLFNKDGGKYAGKKARVVDDEIIEDLEKENALVYKELYFHDYPICWRCKNPLIMISVPQWFFRISKIKKNLIKHNEEVYWIPSYMKLRMKAWLEGISDWPISRSRYWGTPLPIWVCDWCGRKEVIGSIKELEKKSKKKIIEVHKPEIDEIFWKCNCGGKMKRVPEVLDVWFDSGVSSWAALGYPKKTSLFKKFWPADLNIEGSDQFRGWWNSQIILSNIKFGKKPYKNIVVHGMVLGLGKVKMSKSLGNTISPQEFIEKYGRDKLRYYFAKVSKGEDFAGFDEEEFKKIQNFFRVLININNYINLLEKGKLKLNIEDKWIISRFNSFLKDIKESFDKFKFPEGIQKIEKFLIDDLSKTYIKIIRERENEIYEILNRVRNDLLVVLSPIIPFITESIWQSLRKKGVVKPESVHLSSWPKANQRLINKKLEKNFENLFKVIEKGLAERDKAGIGLRWPLKSLNIIANFDINKKLIDIIKSQLNVKEVYFKKISKELPMGFDIKLDTKLTSELESEGYAREISRQIQFERKKAGLTKKDKIILFVLASDLNLLKRIDLKSIANKVNAKKYSAGHIIEDVKVCDQRYSCEFEIKGKKFKICFSKVR